VANGFDGRADVRTLLSFTSIVKAENRPIASAGKQPPRDRFRRERPVAPEGSPHDPKQPKLFLGFSQSEPSHPVWRSKERRNRASGLSDCLLGKAQLIANKPGGLEIEARMRVGMVADLMPARKDGSSNLGEASNMHAALKESGADTQPVEDVQ
jgi:hypothetical protein